MIDTDQLLELWSQSGFSRPTFSRPQVAKLLNCTALTVANREAKEIYPEPKRHHKSNHRFYTLQDVFLLQYITLKGQINLSSIASLLWDMGYNLTNKVLPCLREEIILFKSTLPTEPTVVEIELTDIADAAEGGLEW